MKKIIGIIYILVLLIELYSCNEIKVPILKNENKIHQEKTYNSEIINDSISSRDAYYDCVIFKSSSDNLWIPFTKHAFILEKIIYSTPDDSNIFDKIWGKIFGHKKIKNKVILKCDKKYLVSDRKWLKKNHINILNITYDNDKKYCYQFNYDDVLFSLCFSNYEKHIKW